MKRRIKTSVVALLFSIIFLNNPSFADDCSDLRETVIDQEHGTLLNTLAELYRADCLAQDKSKNPHLNTVLQDAGKWKMDPTWEILRRREEMATQLKAIQSDMATALLSKEPSAQMALTVMHNHLDYALEEVRQFSTRPDYGGSSWVFTVRDYTIPLINTPSINLEEVALSGCRETPALCRQAFSEIQIILTYAFVVKQVLDQWFEDAANNANEAAQYRNKQWESYIKDTRTMSLLEMLGNDVLHDTRPEGLIAPPKAQWILMHPSASLEYSTKGNQTLVPAITLELLGYNYWGWKDNGFKGESSTPYGDMGFAIGGSAIINFSSRAGHSTISYGGMLHLNNKLSVYVTRGSYDYNGEKGHDLRMGLNLNVLALFQKSLKKANEYKARLEQLP